MKTIKSYNLAKISIARTFTYICNKYHLSRMNIAFLIIHFFHFTYSCFELILEFRIRLELLKYFSFREERNIFQILEESWVAVISFLNFQLLSSILIKNFLKHFIYSFKLFRKIILLIVLYNFTQIYDKHAKSFSSTYRFKVRARINLSFKHGIL